MSPLRITTILFLVACLALTGCAETDTAVVDTVEAEESFEVTPTVGVTGTSYRTDIRVDHVFLGIGQIILEPLDDLNAPIISNREPASIIYDESMLIDAAIIEMPSLQVPRAGRYLVTLAVEPQTHENPGPKENTQLLSVSMLGRYFYARPGEDPEMSPEPVPWEPVSMGDAGQVLPEDVVSAPFSYSSGRTGYIRLGEVELSPNLDELHIQINLEGWLDQALTPILADISNGPSNTPNLDVSSQLEGFGLGLEKLFMLSEAISL